MNSFEILQWDSVFFGFKVARVLQPKLNEYELKKILEEMRICGVTLAYWNTDPDDEDSQSSAQGVNAFLADNKTTFVTSLQDFQSSDLNITGSELRVEEYLDAILTPELEDLALQAGDYSRFKLDPCIAESKFKELYKTWITRSLEKKIADGVFVLRSEDKITGMVTVGEKNCRADIGLIAVESFLRGNNAGRALVHAAQNWGYRKGYSHAQVVTQGHNLSACRFYIKCGYHVEKVENIYHLWVRS